MSNSPYHINQLAKSNLNDLEKLHGAVYGKLPPVNLYSKKYDTAYTKAEYIGFLAYNEQMMPIAYYGVTPCFIWCNGKTILAAQSVDTMTHPGYRNQGLFVELAKQTFNLCHDTCIRVVFGFPNQNSLPGFINKLGWQMTERMDCFIIPVNAMPLEGISVKFPLLKKLYATYTHWVIKKHAATQHAISGAASADGYNGILRNDDYLNYKTYTTTYVINIDQATIWVKISNGLMIGDILGVTANNFAEIISKLLKLASRLGLKQLQFHTSPNTQLHALFSGRYKAIPSFPVIFKDLIGDTTVDKIKFTFADIDIF